MASLEARLAALEAAAATVASNVACAEWPATLQRVAADLLARGALGCQLYRTPMSGDAYYARPLPERAAVLGCPPDRLCKTLVFVNTANEATTSPGAPLGRQRFVAVLLQYQTKLDVAALERALRQPQHGGGSDLRLRAAADAAALTGFGHNAVTPYGSATPLPLVVTKQIAQLPPPAFVWLGGGEADVKLRVFVSQLLQRGDPRAAGGGVPVVVMDVAVARDADDEDD